MRNITAAILGLLLVTCSDPGAVPSARTIVPVPAAESERTQALAPVILVTVDGARWQDVFGAIDDTLGFGDARMPVLRSLVLTRGAAVGAPGFGRIDASGPNFVSMPGYTEIFTGRASSCTNNECGSPTEPTFLDDLADRGARIGVFSSWEKIGRAASRASGLERQHPRAFHVSSGRPEGDASDPFPGAGAYRPDARTASLALAYLREVEPDVLVVSLGDPDEYAHRGDRAGYLRALGELDTFLGALTLTLEGMGERGAETSLFVTTDHGRSDGFRDHGEKYPESSRVWLAASGPRIEARGFVNAKRGARHLKDLAATILAVSERTQPEEEIALTELFAR